MDEGQWGLDHGTWSVLVNAFPQADIPVVQLGLDVTLSPGGGFDIGRKLAPLRDEGVLIMGTGNIVHNLRRHDLERPEGRRPSTGPPGSWARCATAIAGTSRSG